jgi:uncharacterized repeat protein (TIGR01451 family)
MIDHTRARLEVEGAVAGEVRTTLSHRRLVLSALLLPIVLASVILSRQYVVGAALQAEIRFAASADPMVEVSGPVQYRITVSNWGFAEATRLLVTHVLPDGFAYESGSSEVEVDGQVVSLEDPDVQAQSLTWGEFGIAAASGVFDNHYGVHTFIQDLCTESYVDLQLDKALELVGVGGYVTQLLYPVTEATLGPNPCWVYFVDEAYNRQLIPVVRLQGEWGGDFWLKPEPDSPGDYASLAKAYKRVVKGLPRRDGHLLYVQVWNEPDLPLEWSGEANAVEYGHFFVDVAAAIHRIGDSRIKVLNGALTPGNASFTRQLTGVPRFVDSFDLWASHCYPLNHPPAYNIHNGTARYPQYAIDSYLLELQALSTYGGRRGVKVVLTETGYALHDRTFRFEGYPAITEDNRAHYMRRAFRDFWASWSEVVGVTAFELVDPYGTWQEWDWLYPGTDLPHKQYTVVSGQPKPEPLEVFPSALVISFQARAAGVAGTYRSDVTATAENATIYPLLSAAPVIVVDELHTQHLPLGAGGGATLSTSVEAESQAESASDLDHLLDQLEASAGELPLPFQGPITYLGDQSHPEEGPTIRGRIELGADPQGVALDPRRDRVYVTLSDGGLVAVDTQSDRVVCVTRVGRDPQGVAVDQSTGLVYVADHGSGTLSVVAGLGCGGVTTLTGLEGPNAVAVDESTGRIYVGDCAADQVVVLETDSQQVVNRLSVGSCPENLALDRESGFLYVGHSGDGTVSVIDLEDLEITATVRVSQGPVFGLATDEAAGEAYVVCLDAPPRRRLAVVDGDKGEVERSLSGGWDRPLSGTYAAALDTDRGRLYVADGQELLLLNAEDLTLTSVTSVDAAIYSLGLAVDGSRERIYLVDSAGGALLVLEH